MWYLKNMWWWWMYIHVVWVNLFFFSFIFRTLQMEAFLQLAVATTEWWPLQYYYWDGDIIILTLGNLIWHNHWYYVAMLYICKLLIHVVGKLYTCGTVLSNCIECVLMVWYCILSWLSWLWYILEFYWLYQHCVYSVWGLQCIASTHTVHVPCLLIMVHIRVLLVVSALCV